MSSAANALVPKLIFRRAHNAIGTLPNGLKYLEQHFTAPSATSTRCQPAVTLLPAALGALDSYTS
eukprot:5758805-Amphidinium_carterae.1